MPSDKLSLYEIENELAEAAAALENDEASPDDQTLAADIVATYLQGALDKREAVGRYRLSLVAREAMIDVELKRLQDAKRRVGATLRRLDGMIESVLWLLNATQLDGHTVRISLRKNPPAVTIAEPALVPEEFLDAHVVMPLRAWNALVGGPVDMFVARHEPNRTRLHNALRDGPVPGAALTQGHRVEVK